MKVLEACKAGKPIPMEKWGSKPMNGQLSCEGPMVRVCQHAVVAVWRCGGARIACATCVPPASQGKTTLKVVPGPPKMRELAPKVDPASIKRAMMY